MTRLFLSFTLSLGALSVRAQQYQPLSDLGTLGGSVTSVVGVNNAGQVVGRAVTSSGSTDSFLYSGGVMHDIGAFSATGINNSSQVCGNTGTTRCIWQNYTLTAYAQMGVLTEARAINDSRQVVGDYQTAYLPDGTGHALIWQNGTYTDLDPTSQFPRSSNARAVTNASLIVGQAQVSNGGTAGIATFSEGQIHYLGAPNDSTAYAKDANDAGQMVCNGSGGGYSHIFLYEAGQTTDLGTLGGMASQGKGLNAAGQIVGWSTLSGQTAHRAFVWQSGTMTDLNSLADPASGWVLTEADAISDTGFVCGIGTHNGQTRAFLMQIPTAPALIVPVSLSFTPGRVAGGQTSYCTLRLSGTAPSGGLTVDLTLDGQTSTLFVPAGQSSASFGADLDSVGHSVVTATATLNNVTVSGSYIVESTPPVTTATVSGATVTLSATDPDGAADVAATYYTVDGGTQQTYSTPFMVSSAGTHTITYWSADSVGNTEKSHSLTVAPPKLSLMSLGPSSATAGSAAFTLTLTGTGFASNSIVKWNGAEQATTFVSSTKLTASIPATLVAAAGTAFVTVVTPKVAASGSKTFTIKAAPAVMLSALSFNPSAVKGGSVNTTGTVTLTGPAPAGGTVVSLASSNGAITFSASSVTVAAGATSATFHAYSHKVTSQKTVTVTASGLGTSKTATVTVTL